MNADSNPSPSMPEPAPRVFSFWHAFGRHWQASVRYYGLRHTIAQVAEAAYRFLRELLPDRREITYGDLDYDFDHVVDTTRANVRLRTQFIAALASHQYFPSEPWLFEQIMQALPINFGDFTFVDLGSGKGRALLMAAPFGFKRIMGVEFMPEWHHVAQENIRKLAAEDATIAAIENLCMDARDFDFPAEPLVVYIFNPFPEPTFATVLEKLRRSVEQAPRPIYIAYRFTEFEELLAQAPWLKKIAGAEQWAVYEGMRAT